MRIAIFTLAVLCSLTPLRADDARVLFSDHFATLDPGWGEANANKSVSGNNLVLKPDVNSAFSNIYRGNLFGDCDIRVKVRETDGGTDNFGGIVFWAADTENFYVAQARPDGLVGITRIVQGRQLTPLGYAANDAVAKGVGQVNELRVVTLGKSATLDVNGKRIATIKGFPPQGGSRIGLHGESGDKVYTWQFSDLEVRQAAAAGAPAVAAASTDASVIFADDFSTLDPAWGPPDGQQSVSGGKLVFQPTANQSYTSLYQASFFGDADIRVKISQTSGNADETAGIVFWAANYSNYYVAQVQADGLVGITRLMEGQQLTPVGFAASDAVAKGLGQVNELRVVTLGKTATLYVNGKPIATCKGFPPDGDSKIGLHGESGGQPYTWQFSDFQVRQPAAAPGAASAPAVADAALLFSDDFSTLDPGWGPADGEQSVSSGKLYFQPTAGTSYTSLFQGTLFKDADFRVNISEINGGTDQPVGIVFWATDYKNCYAAQMRGDGSVGISQLTQGTWRAPVPYTVRDAAAKGIGQTNELRVVTRGKQATLYVNGQQIVSLEGTPPDAGSKIGLRAVSGTQAVYTWQFSGLVVRKP